MNNEKIRIAIDMMGGDHAPKITVEGACNMSLESPVQLLLVGDETLIRNEMEKHACRNENIRIIHTPDSISMQESPKKAINEKPDASVLLAARLLKEGKADAMVSAGSTGAVILAAATHLNRIPGVKRTALGTIIPTLNEKKRADIYTMMLDIGANVSNSADDLVHFAYMGISYKKKMMNVASPSVGLLNIGAEDHKGNETMKTAYRILTSRPDIDFIGNIEGNDLVKGAADIVVAEGMSGNIAIKTMEGASEAVKKIAGMAMRGKLIWKLGLLCLSGGIKKLMKAANYEEYGGAPVFGFDRLVIKCHGRSSAYAFKNGIAVAIRAVQDDMIGIMRDSISQYEVEKDQ
jgi:phosphate acyltransferase